MTTTDALAEQFARLARAAYEDPMAHPQWEQAAADVFIHGRPMRKLIAASEAVDRLADLHMERRWADDSDTTVCAECKQSWPCRTVQALSGELVPS